jgi:tRNA threonylcarbamoyladenosine biosynthesis protein TsaB
MLLAIDTSTRSMGIGLHDGSQVCAEFVWQSQNYHTVELAPAVEDLLKKCQVDANHLVGVAVAIGPGSFTGLRIGLGFAKGLALANNLPLLGIPTMDILAAAQPIQDEPMLILIKAGRERFAVNDYFVVESTWQASGTIRVMKLEEIAHSISSRIWVCGEMTADDRVYLQQNVEVALLSSPALSLRRPSFLAELGWQKLRSGDIVSPEILSPIYLHFNESILAD